MSGKLGTVHKRRKDAAKHNYYKAEVNRLSGEGFSLSKVAKLLSIPYSLAKRLADIDT